jgi:signal transduction histidine kinase
MKVRMDQQDLEEILGNTLENAFKWSRTEICVSAGATAEAVTIRIEDDGPGIPEDARREALRSGGRLDMSMPGTGLGLAIVGDLVAAYGGVLHLEASSELHGLCVRVVVPNQISLGTPDLTA